MAGLNKKWESSNAAAILVSVGEDGCKTFCEVLKLQNMLKWPKQTLQQLQLFLPPFFGKFVAVAVVACKRTNPI